MSRRWEYQILAGESGMYEGHSDDMVEELHKADAEGWEAVTVWLDPCGWNALVRRPYREAA